MQNVAKYAEASRIELEMAATVDTLRFSVRDDGRGFDPETVSRGIGLQGMSDRLEAIGGSLVVESAPGSGTSITGAVPARPLEPASAPREEAALVPATTD